MIKKLFGRIISISKWSLIVLSIFPVSSAKAELATYTVTGANDLWFTYTEPSDFKVRTYAWEYGIDSMLWLYDANGVLLAQNDDFFGLDSWLEVAVHVVVIPLVLVVEDLLDCGIDLDVGVGSAILLVELLGDGFR